MRLHHVLPLALLPFSRAAETVLGVYIFSRHGDRTAKSTPPANLTDLGYKEIFTSGTYFRDRYVSSSATSRISGLNADIVKLSQISASAPLDNVLMSSAQGFLQGLYPPVGPELGQEKLRNNTVVQAPLNGYQLIPIQTVTSGTGSEDSAWLQGSGNCAKAIVSSNTYYTSSEYISLSNSTMDFYKSIAPTVNATFGLSDINFKNAYASKFHFFNLPSDSIARTLLLVFDLLNVAEIHNATIPSSDLITNSTLTQLRTLADAHEFSLAYNITDPIRAVAGATLAAQIVQALNTTITSAGKTSKLTLQLGAYASFQSLFGLTNLTSQNADFFGVPDYASTMTFELFTTTAPIPFPAAQDLQVRFLFHNGTTSNSSTPIPYSLFGSPTPEMSWADFTTGMNKFAIGDQAQWCQACGNSTGVCASSSGASSSPSSSNQSTGGGSGGGVSKPVAGVIGAMVTLAVILGVEAAIMLVAGLRLVSKKRLGSGVGAPNGNGAAATKA